ncbi:MAG: hypothetical protein VKL23_04010 [Cyanobacteriota bacterium]|nr:hypothetical protein [Cyanobacteriota bacterium]
MRRLSREDLQRLRHRHQGYIITLVVEAVLLLSLPLAQRWGWLLSLLLVALAGVLLGCLSRYSALRRTRPLVYGLGALAIILELLWHGLGLLNPTLARPLTLPHVIAWLGFLAIVLLRKVRTLMREPYVTLPVVLGAAAGYLLVGIAGGLLLTALWVFNPSAFNPAALPIPTAESAGGLLQLGNLFISPALMASAINLLTTVGSPVLNPRDISAQVCTAVITVTGQLYVAILIALILGRFQQRLR